MLFIDLQTEVKDLINFTSGADQDFTTEQVKTALNRRYEHELSMASQTGGSTWFHKTYDFTWGADAATLTVPSAIDRANLLEFEDVTDNDPGVTLPGEVFWKDNQTLQWGENGPGSARTIRAIYLARPAQMVNDADEPELIPPQYRMLLVWSAAVYLRQKADESSPVEWRSELNEARLDFWKAVSRGRPYYGGGSSVSRWRDPTVSGAQVTQDGSSINQDNN